MEHYCIYCMRELLEGDKECPFCGMEQNYTSLPHQLKPGTILCNRYYVGKAIGQGGFGITYIGMDTTLDIRVAIKEYYPSTCVNRNNASSLQVLANKSEDFEEFFEKGKQSFLVEARKLAKLSDEQGIVNVQNYFEENNTAYIVMEYLEGETLKAHLVNRGTLSPKTTIQLLLPVMHSLSSMHKQGIIHRDISPDNIMIIGENKAKLLDFGSARFVSAAASRSLSIVIKPGFAPEEQYRSKGKQGPWTDIYALCATIYVCITGIIPDDAPQRLHCDEIKTPSALGIYDIDINVENAIMKGLSVNQADRYQSIEEFLRGLAGEKAKPDIERKTLINQELRDIEILPVPKEEQDTASEPQERNNDDERKTGTQKDEHKAKTAEQEPGRPTLNTKPPNGSKRTNGNKHLTVLQSALIVIIVCTIGVILFFALNGDDHLPDENDMITDAAKLLRQSEVNGDIVSIDLISEEEDSAQSLYLVNCVIAVEDKTDLLSISVQLVYELNDGDAQFSIEMSEVTDGEFAANSPDDEDEITTDPPAESTYVTPYVDSITLKYNGSVASGSHLYMYDEGSKLTISADISSDGAVNAEDIIWVSSNPSVISIAPADDGMKCTLTKKSDGECTIIVNIGTVSDSLTVVGTPYGYVGGVNSENIFSLLPDYFYFSAGAGGWWTQLYINDDGSFSGRYIDSELGYYGSYYREASEYYIEGLPEEYDTWYNWCCDFTGRFEVVEQVSNYEFKLEVKDLKYNNTPGTWEQETVDGEQLYYVYTEPRGMTDYGYFYLYLPGRETSDLDDECIWWIMADVNDFEEADYLKYWGLYNTYEHVAYAGMNGEYPGDPAIGYED